MRGQLSWPLLGYARLGHLRARGKCDARHISSHNLNVTCFSQMLFMPHMCVTLWETWPFIPYNPHGKPNFGNLFISTQVGNSGFWNLGFRFALFENVFPCPPRPPDVQLHTLMFGRCWGGGFCNPALPPPPPPHRHRPATHVKARSGQNQILQLFKLESCPDTKTQHTGRAWGNARFYFRSVSRDNIKKATKVNQWPAAESPEANLQVRMYQTRAPKC